MKKGIRDPRAMERAIHPVRIIVVLALLSAFPPLATDMYLSGFPLMATDFGIPEGRVGITLSSFFLGLAVGQAVYGPLIDTFGRRAPLLFGILLYVATTVFCLVTRDITWFTASRFLQAVGGCSGMVIGRAIINDLFDEQESARALSLMMMIMTAGPITAPILGGFVVGHAGWEATFAIMLAIGLVAGGLVWRFVPETLPAGQAGDMRISRTLSIWWLLLRNGRFLAPTVIGGLAQACLFAFITGSPFVFMTLHGLTPEHYGLLFALITGALIVAAQINRMALRRFNPETLLGAGLVVNMAAGLGVVAAVPTGNFPFLVASLWVAAGTVGLIGANSAASAMKASGSHPGNGSALIGVLQFSCAFLVSTIIAATQNGTAYPMALTLAACGIPATLLWFTVGRRAAGGRVAATPGTDIADGVAHHTE